MRQQEDLEDAVLYAEVVCLQEDLEDAVLCGEAMRFPEASRRKSSATELE